MERDQRQGEGRAAADVDANEIQAMDDIQQGLLAAARNGETTTIKGILSELDDQTRRRYLLEGYPNRLPLHAAAAAGHKKVLEILIPPDPEHPKAVDSKTKKRQLTALHLAVIHGHKDVSRWLVQERHANIDLGEEGGLTALHLAMKFQRREVVQLLVSLKANPFILDSEGRFPISDCKSERMFQAFFSKFPTSTFSSIQVNASATDRYGRTILHYAAQCANSDVIANLLPEEHSNLYVKDTNGDSVFHIAAKYGNMELFKALDIASIDINPRFFPPEEFDNHLLKSPAMCALLHDQRKFFDELVRRGLAKITLSSIIKALILELKEKPKITDRLELLGRTLPTYLALYANKDFVFDFLLFNGLTLNQQDDKYCRTCLHWAIDDGRTDIVQKIMKNRKVEPWPGIEDRDGKTAQQLAFEKEDEIGQMITLLLNRKSSFKEHEERLNRDREVYVQALNAILVGAALIASVTFAGWLQVPYGSEFSSSAMRVYWAANSISFFTAVATMCVTKIGLIPTPGQYVGAMVNHLRVAILLDAFLLALSLAAVMLAFGAAGFAALRQAHIGEYEVIMRSTAVVGGLLCLATWLAYVYHLIKRKPSITEIFSLLSPFHFSFLKSRPGNSFRAAYSSMKRGDLHKHMGKSLDSETPGKLNIAPSEPSVSNDEQRKLGEKLRDIGMHLLINNLLSEGTDESSQPISGRTSNGERRHSSTTQAPTSRCTLAIGG